MEPTAKGAEMGLNLANSLKNDESGWSYKKLLCIPFVIFIGFLHFKHSNDSNYKYFLLFDGVMLGLFLGLIVFKDLSSLAIMLKNGKGVDDLITLKNNKQTTSDVATP